MIGGMHLQESKFICREHRRANIKLMNTVSADKAYSHLLIMGDFNLPKIDWDSWSTRSDKDSGKFIECLRDNYLYQHVNEFTRCRKGNEPSILDILITNEEEMIREIKYNDPIGSSDHLVMNFKYQCEKVPNANKEMRLNYRKGDYEKMRENMPTDWRGLLSGSRNVQNFY